MSKKEVDQWFAKYDNPMKPVVQRVREILLAADDRLEEVIKWQSPTFLYKGNLASFNPKSKKHASLMFHIGAKIPGKFTHLEGSGDTARYMSIPSVKDAEALKREIQAIVKAWIKLKDSE